MRMEVYILHDNILHYEAYSNLATPFPQRPPPPIQNFFNQEDYINQQRPSVGVGAVVPSTQPFQSPQFPRFNPQDSNQWNGTHNGNPYQPKNGHCNGPNSSGHRHSVGHTWEGREVVGNDQTTQPQQYNGHLGCVQEIDHSYRNCRALKGGVQFNGSANGMEALRALERWWSDARKPHYKISALFRRND